MSQHTKLPWKLCNEGKCPCLTIDGEHHPIATIESGKWGDEYPSLRLVGPSLDLKVEAYKAMIIYGEIPFEVALANARLIVIAVNSHYELLEACKRISDASYGVALGDLEFLRAAIAKAEAGAGNSGG